MGACPPWPRRAALRGEEQAESLTTGSSSFGALGHPPILRCFSLDRAFHLHAAAACKLLYSVHLSLAMLQIAAGRRRKVGAPGVFLAAATWRLLNINCFRGADVG